MRKVITPAPAVAEYEKVIQSYLRGYKAASAENRIWWRSYFENRTSQICSNHGIKKDELLDAWFKWLDEVDAI